MKYLLVLTFLASSSALASLPPLGERVYVIGERETSMYQLLTIKNRKFSSAKESGGMRDPDLTTSEEVIAEIEAKEEAKNRMRDSAVIKLKGLVVKGIARAPRLKFTRPYLPIAPLFEDFVLRR